MLEVTMAIQFHGMDPENPGNNCPAVFRDDAAGDFYFQGATVVNPEILTRIAADSPLLDTESVVKLPARMVEIIMEACCAGVVR
jgi:hypothetical protein